MRYVTFIMSQDGGPHQVSRLLADEPAVTRVGLLRLNVLSDGTIALLGHLRGDLNRVRELLGEQSAVVAYDVSGEDEGLAYIHARSNETITRLMRIPQQYEVFFEMPFEPAGRNGLRATLIGRTSDALQRAIEAIPDEVALTLERTGAYPPAEEELTSLLTERQREVLTVAVTEGYYDRPRRTTHREIATQLEISASTVSVHLRTIEAKVFSTLIESEGG